MITVEIRLELLFPYNRSMDKLAAFCDVWDSRIFSGSTQKSKAIISMPVCHFKKIFGTNPRVQKYSVPSGAEKFIESLEVIKINVK
jgi:hypothetical protein